MNLNTLPNEVECFSTTDEKKYFLESAGIRGRDYKRIYVQFDHNGDVVTIWGETEKDIGEIYERKY